MENIWEFIKPILAIIFLFCCLTLPSLAIYLGLLKKKLDLYIRQIKKDGRITKNLNNLIVGFDILLIANVFNSVPNRSIHPEYFKFEKVNRLEKKIQTLVKITKPLAITTITVTVLLIVLLNLYEG